MYSIGLLWCYGIFFLSLPSLFNILGDCCLGGRYVVTRVFGVDAVQLLWRYGVFFLFSMKIVPS